MVQSIIAFALLLATLMVGAFLVHVYSHKREKRLVLSAGGWGFYALHYICSALSPWLGICSLLYSLNYGLFGLAGICFLLGTQLYTRTKLWLGPSIGAAVFILLWSAANAFQIFAVPSIIPSAVIYIIVGLLFWQESRNQETMADRLLSLAFLGWGLIGLTVMFLETGHEALWQAILPISGIPTLFVTMLQVMAIYEEEKRRVERNMLAQALDRVPGVVRLPAGAMFRHHGDPNGPTSVVSAGLPEEFCRAAQNEGLDDYLVGLVSRLGGLLGFRDLRDDNLSALERDEPIRRFRELAMQHGLRSVVVISPQAKEQAFGLLLLGTPDSRRFTSAELRLLLALGHQIGMAVENSYLIQQTSRRSEELHVLNEIGRALSSTLNKEDLLRRIWEELRRLFDVENFYLASLDPPRDLICFEVETIHGVRMPKRSRPAGNHLTEYVLRTRQPILIRDNYVTEVRKLGVEPIRTAGSFCGVPLVAYDRAVGALCVFSDQDRAFDEGHLELLRVLASEASIAIENARLFQEERTKARHLSLLNLISRDAIATLNPDEVLAKITEQLENGLTYDHIGIATLDYTTRELVVSAEGGQRRGAIGRRLPLDAC